VTDIYISEQAFLGLILAAAEVYRRECYGLLFGYSLPGKAIVEGAIAYQTAERKFSTVSLYARQNKVIQKVISQFPKHEYVGEFHSHPDYGGYVGDPGLGLEDAVGVGEAEVQLVIAINPRRRTVAWSTNRDGTLSGTLGDHHYRIGGYYLRRKGETAAVAKREGRRKVSPQLARARVFCPYAVGLNPGGSEAP
jgi:proteasome lid subunit RPN8/RPN11